MAKREFKLPGIEDLNKEQENVRALSLEGQHLIVGGPGTGKSVMALLKAKRMHEEKKRYCFLVFNHLLNQANKQLFDLDVDLVSRQWQSWFIHKFERITGKYGVPGSPPGSLNFLWGQVLEALAEKDDDENTYLIIDESQDMPPEFYQCIASLGLENLFVVADQNQAIEDGKNSSRRDLEDMLALETNDVIELKTNYRNNHAIARLAREFYTGDPASPPPELPPPPSTQIDIPLLLEYPQQDFDDIIRRVLTMAHNNPTKLLGVIAPNNNVRCRFYNALVSENGKKGMKVKISTYSSDDRKDMAFNEGGIMIINCQACKGLEFDTVFIVGLSDYPLRSAPDYEETRKLFYVMVARAIDRVIMLKEKGRHCLVEKILPEDSQILERK